MSAMGRMDIVRMFLWAGLAMMLSLAPVSARAAETRMYARSLSGYVSLAAEFQVEFDDAGVGRLTSSELGPVRMDLEGDVFYARTYPSAPGVEVGAKLGYVAGFDSQVAAVLLDSPAGAPVSLVWRLEQEPISLAVRYIPADGSITLTGDWEALLSPNIGTKLGFAVKPTGLLSGGGAGTNIMIRPAINYTHWFDEHFSVMVEINYCVDPGEDPVSLKRVCVPVLFRYEL